MASSSSSSSSSKHRRSYDVFLSFRGTEVRNYFLGHLYTALVQSGINTYMDSEDLKKGEQISPALMEAIEESQIAIIVFSKDFASSPWCLEEVAKIMECKEQRDLMVFPVFYKVEPREVRGQREGYAEAMAKHVVKFGEDSEKVKRWKKALLDAGSLSGWHFMDGYEAGLTQQIVQEISIQLDRTPLNVAKYPVGIDIRVQELPTILNLQSKGDIRMVGLWGQGGIGKTTLAKAIYNAISREFQGSSFLDRIRENSKSFTNLVYLQEKLLSQVLRKKLTVFSVDAGSQLIHDRLRNKKVLIILDDVDDECQLNALAGDCKWFGKGSRIIITTRNKHLLTSHGIHLDHLYRVPALEYSEALELFRKHAFLRSQKIEISSNLVDRVLHYAGGLPLALEVLGSFLCGRGEQEWESALQKLSKSLDKKISDALKVSYDGLEDYVKEIFLDIACFFKGQETKYIKKVLDGCDFDTTIGVEILIERSLISKEEGTLQMHDLIQLMAVDIVKGECRDDPDKHSRLWHYDDVLEVLSGDAGTDAIKAIVLKLPNPEETYICPNAFTNMRKLRLLILHNVHNSFQGPIHLPNQLRWLECHDCVLIPEFGYGAKKLVGLDMQNSMIEQAPKNLKDFKTVKFINLFQNHSPKNLVSLNLKFCKFVKDLPKELCCMKVLEELLIDGTSIRMIHFQRPASMERLQILSACQCESLACISDSIGQLKSLTYLGLDGATIDRLPYSIGSLKKLQRLLLGNCQKLPELPYSIGDLESLELMDLSSTMIARLPRSVRKLKKLRVLKMENSHLRKFPKDIKNLDKLEEIDLSKCKNLKGPIRCDMKGLSSLKILRLSSTKTSGLPWSDDKYSHHQTLSSLSLLQRLDLSECDQVRALPILPSNLTSLRWGSKKMRTVPDLSYLKYLKELYLGGITDATQNSSSKPPKIGWVTSLQHLEILELRLSKIKLPENFSTLKLRKLVLHYADLLDLRELPSRLSTLYLHHCEIEVPQFSKVRCLSELVLEHCDLAKMSIEDLKLLELLKISDCTLKTLDGLEYMLRLRKLTLFKCPSLSKLPDQKKYKFEIDMRNY